MLPSIDAACRTARFNPVATRNAAGESLKTRLAPKPVQLLHGLLRVDACIHQRMGCSGRTLLYQRHESNRNVSYRVSASGGGSGGRNGGGWDGSGGEDEDGDDHNPGHHRGTVLVAAFLGGTGCLVLLDDAKAERSGTAMVQDRVSIVIPVLNESKTIGQTLCYLSMLEPAPHEIIVVDGGSTDGTPSLVKKHGVRLIRSERGRGRQMNAGAEHATGGIFCFLHADTLPPLNLVSLVRSTMNEPKVVLGGFFPLIQTSDRVLWFSTLHNAVKTWYAPMLFRPLSYFRGLRLLFGDQAQFCRAADFRAVGGFKSELVIMEDADLCIRMHEQALGDGQRGRIRMLPTVVQTSGRRIGNWGALRSTYIHFRIALEWYLGGTPEDLRRTYKRIYTDQYR